MNFLLHRHKSSSNIVPIPDGLRELMSDISREVLRSQPHNILLFIADYLEALERTRDYIFCAQQCIETIMKSSLVTSGTLRESGISQGQANVLMKNAFESQSGIIKNPRMSENPLQELGVLKRLKKECRLTNEQAQKAVDILEIAYNNYFHSESDLAVFYAAFSNLF